MEEVRRVDTTTKGKKGTTILLVFAGLLGISLIGAAMYFYTSTEREGDSPETFSEVTCACYYIDPTVVSECTDTRRGFMFETQTVTSDQNCRAACSTSNLITTLLNSTTRQELYQVCHVQSLQDARCSQMVVKDQNQKIVTGKVSANEKLTVEATFDEQYSDHKFIVNNQYLDPDSISLDNLVATIEISEISTNTITISATAKDRSGGEIDSPLCKRLVEIEQAGVASVSDIQVQTRRAADSYKISRIRVNVGNISQDDDISLRFSFKEEEFVDLVMSEGFTIDSTRGEISIIEQDLYNKENFETERTFSQFDGKQGKYGITVEVRKDNQSLGTATTTFELLTVDPTSEPIGEPETEESNFEVSKSSTKECFERVSPNNIADFTVNIKNNSSIQQNLVSVKDKLPLGFKYIENSTKLNGTSVSDSAFVKVTNIGDTQEIVWQKTEDWSVPSGQTITIEFETTVGQDALSGSNQNEVILSPAEVPSDPSTLRTELVILVAQNCEEPGEPEQPEQPGQPVPPIEDPTIPETGIFDSVVGRVIVGMIVLVIGWYLYSRPMGHILIEKFVDSKVFEKAERTSWRIFKPKRYFEVKVMRKLRKKKVKN